MSRLCLTKAIFKLSFRNLTHNIFGNNFSGLTLATLWGHTCGHGFVFLFQMSGVVKVEMTYVASDLRPHRPSTLAQRNISTCIL